MFIKSKIFFLIISFFSLISCVKDEVTHCIVNYEVTDYYCINNTLGDGNTLNKNNEFDAIDFESYRIGLYHETQPTETFYCNPTQQIIDSTDNIIITTNVDYNNEFEKGDTINSMILLKHYNETSMLTDTLQLNDYLSNKTVLKDYAFILNSKPNESKKVSLRFMIESDNQTYIVNSDTIYLELN